MSLLDVATPLTVLPSVSCQDAIDIMNKEGFDQLPVVDQAGSVAAAMWCSGQAGGCGALGKQGDVLLWGSRDNAGKLTRAGHMRGEVLSLWTTEG